MAYVLTPEELDEHGWIALHMPRAGLDDAAERALLGRLSDDERARYDATPRSHGKSQFLLGRSLMRAAVAAATGRDPATVTFVSSDDGKPALATGATVGFNLSHCSSHLLIGLSRHPHVGVDIEDIRPYPDRLPRRFFLPDEVAYIDSLAPAERPAAFFHFWVIKEACIKARGRTLGPSLATVPAATSDRGTHEGLEWHVIDAGPDVKAAIALEAGDDKPGLVRAVALEEVL